MTTKAEHARTAVTDATSQQQTNPVSTANIIPATTIVVSVEGEMHYNGQVSPAVRINFCRFIPDAIWGNAKRLVLTRAFCSTTELRDLHSFSERTAHFRHPMPLSTFVALMKITEYFLGNNTPKSVSGYDFYFSAEALRQRTSMSPVQRLWGVIDAVITNCGGKALPSDFEIIGNTENLRISADTYSRPNAANNPRQHF